MWDSLRVLLRNWADANRRSQKTGVTPWEMLADRAAGLGSEPQRHQHRPNRLAFEWAFVPVMKNGFDEIVSEMSAQSLELPK